MSSLLFASEFQKPAERLSILHPGLPEALNQSINLCQGDYASKCVYYPPDYDFYYRQSSPTRIDIAITVYIVGKKYMNEKYLFDNY